MSKNGDRTSERRRMTSACRIEMLRSQWRPNQRTAGFSCRWISPSPTVNGTARSPQCRHSRVNLHPVAAHGVQCASVHDAQCASCACVSCASCAAAGCKKRATASSAVRPPEQFSRDATPANASGLAALFWTPAEMGRIKPWDTRQQAYRDLPRGCVGGAVLPKHYCSPGGGRIARRP